LIIIIVVLALLAVACFAAGYGLTEFTSDKHDFVESDNEEIQKEEEIGEIEIPSKQTDLGEETKESSSVKVEETDVGSGSKPEEGDEGVKN